MGQGDPENDPCAGDQEERGRVADRRDARADQRDDEASLRDSRADEREELADEREQRLDETEAKQDRRARVVGIPTTTLRQRAFEALERSHAAVKRSGARLRRTDAALQRADEDDARERASSPEKRPRQSMRTVRNPSNRPATRTTAPPHKVCPPAMQFREVPRGEPTS
ncbi:hypothetical protein [Streptomyces sp. NPDC002790]|uniref:hypothetical protein n=1 Tax=Streptomyces sp. NPDC002790 TaxID=3154431 RepID=UPI00332E079B